MLLNDKRGEQLARGAVAKSVPQTMEEADKVAIRLRERDQKIAEAASKCKELSTELKKAQGEKSQLEKEREDDQEMLRAFADPRRDQLTDGGKRKSFRFPCGVVGQWGFPPQPTLVVGATLKTIAKKMLKLPNWEKYIEIKLKKSNIKADLKELGMREFRLERKERFWAKS